MLIVYKRRAITVSLDGRISRFRKRAFCVTEKPGCVLVSRVWKRRGGVLRANTKAAKVDVRGTDYWHSPVGFRWISLTNAKRNPACTRRNRNTQERRYEPWTHKVSGSPRTRASRSGPDDSVGRAHASRCPVGSCWLLCVGVFVCQMGNRGCPKVFVSL